MRLTVQPVSGVASAVTLTAPTKPPCHELATEKVAAQLRGAPLGLAEADRLGEVDGDAEARPAGRGGHRGRCRGRPAGRPDGDAEADRLGEAETEADRLGPVEDEGGVPEPISTSADSAGTTTVSPVWVLLAIVGLARL